MFKPSVLSKRLMLNPTPRYMSVIPNIIQSQYDLIVIGGGSGGLACAKEAALCGAKAAVLDYVEPSLHGTKWGLGGTCVNVGCIPKKLMHLAALHGESLVDAEHYGFTNSYNDISQFDWPKLVNQVQMYIKSLNWGHRAQLTDKRVDYINAYGSLLDPNNVEATQRNGKKKILSTKNVVIATGLRPKYPQIPGANLGISSDDVFSHTKPPGKTLIVGGSYVGLECAGFLQGLGFPVSLLVRSIPLRGFDQQMAGLVAQNLESHGVGVKWSCIPTGVEDGEGQQLKVTWQNAKNESFSDQFDTVLWAIGREPKLAGLTLGNAGVKLDTTSGKIVTSPDDCSNVSNIYAIGDVNHNGLELTPVAILAGKLLSRRLFSNSTQLMEYKNVATTVFTPLEYGCVGLTEEQAVDKLGEDNVEMFHAFYKPLEYAIPGRDSSHCYIKAICERKDTQKVLGFHMTGPNAGEVIQGFGAAINCGLTRHTLELTVGIHPTSAEEVVKLNITKRSGQDPNVSGC